MHKLTINKLVSQVLLLAAALLFSTSLIAGFVDLVITGSGDATKLEIDANDMKCGSDTDCIKTQKGHALDIDFRLKNACKDGGPPYRLSGMQLSLIKRQPQSAGSSTMVKAFGRYVMPAVVAGDFDTEANGTVKWTGGNDLKDDKIKIKNKNDGEYVVFYMIEASKCPGSVTPGPDIIYLDPRIENTGK